MPKELFKLKSAPFDLDAQAARIYETYPRKKNKGDALSAIRKAIKDVGFDVLFEAVAEYAKACKSCRTDPKYIPYPASWIRKRAWEDDRDDWWRGAKDVEAAAAYSRLLKFARRHGLRHPPVDDADFVTAKNVAKLCNGGWAAFCDGKVTEKEFVEVWRNRR